MKSKTKRQEKKSSNDKVVSSEYASTFTSCFKCRSCISGGDEARAVCPSYEKHGFFAYSSGGMVWMGLGLLDGSIEWSPDVADVVYKCTTCGACVAECPQIFISNEYVDQVKIVEAMRAELVHRALGPMPEQDVLIKSIEQHNNPWLQPRSRRAQWAKKKKVEDLSERHEVLYYVGCTAAYDPAVQTMANSTADLLNAAGVEFGILGKDEICCGSTMLRVGAKDAFAKIAERTAAQLREAPADVIVTSCAGCLNTFAHDYPRLGLELGKPVKHIVSYLAELATDGRLKFKASVNKKVTYHDPCHLGRHNRVFDPPRTILNAIPGLQFVEMPRNRMESWCCGAGGGVKTAFPDYALDTAKQRVEEAISTGAEMIVSACPFCEKNLADAAAGAEEKIEIIDITTLAARAI